jgi:hypothetical protein
MEPIRCGFRYGSVQLALLCAIALNAAAQPDTTRRSATAAGTSTPTMLALTGGLILSGAAGAHVIGSPEGWAQTWPGFGSRVADQAGFYLVQTTTSGLMGRALGYRPDAARCPREVLVGCAFRATFTAFDRTGRRRLNAPLVTSIVVGTGASVLWRPERRDATETWAFVGTRLGISFGGYVAERLLVDWWASRRASATSSADHRMHSKSTR